MPRVKLIPDAASPENRQKLAEWCSRFPGERRIDEDHLCIDVSDAQLAELRVFATLLEIDGVEVETDEVASALDTLTESTTGEGTQ